MFRRWCDSESCTGVRTWSIGGVEAEDVDGTLGAAGSSMM